MTQILGLFCPNPDCPEHTVDVTLRRAAGRWWADVDHCPACGTPLSEQPCDAKVSDDRHPVGTVLKLSEAVADALPRDRRLGVSG